MNPYSLFNINSLFLSFSLLFLKPISNTCMSKCQKNSYRSNPFNVSFLCNKQSNKEYNSNNKHLNVIGFTMNQKNTSQTFRIYFTFYKFYCKCFTLLTYFLGSVYETPLAITLVRYSMYFYIIFFLCVSHLRLVLSLEEYW